MLNKFTESARCPKCGCEDISTIYCMDPTPGELCWYMDELENDTEHFHRTCTRCKYEWLELCLDENQKDAT